MKLKVSNQNSDMSKTKSKSRSKTSKAKGGRQQSRAATKSKTAKATTANKNGKAKAKTKTNTTLTNFEVALMDRTKSGGIGDSNNLDVNDLFRLLDLYFYRDFYTYRHLHHSYNKFVDETIPDFLRNNDHVFTEAITEQRVIRHKFEFTNIRAETPKMANEVDPLFPADARKLIQSYQMTVYADVTQYREIEDINSTGETKLKKEKVGHTEEGMAVMTVPTMLRSKYCNLNAHPDEMTDECRYDPGGYFIINGSEKIVISQDKMIPNHPMVFTKKGSNTSFHVVQVNSTSDDLSNMMQTVSIRIRKDGVMVMKFPILYEVNPIIVFRALGIESDADIAELCIYDRTDYHMMDVVRTSLDSCYNDNREGSRIKIRTQEEAIDYLITKMKVVRRYTETNQAIKHEQKKLHLMQLLKTSLLPHIKGNSDNPYRDKALYMGYMINKLMRVELGRDEVDNRDSYCNKRVANINELLTEIMIQHYKSNMSECNKKFMDWMKDKLATEDPYNVIHHFKASVFEQGFKSALMQGNWPRAKGVSQMLGRNSYMQLISFLSRIDSQSSSKSSSKLTKPRQTDPSSIPFLCLAGDSEVLQGDNATVEQIKDMRNGDYVTSVYREDLREIKTGITNFFTQTPDRMVKITTISGRTLKCTPDHPILVRRGDTCEMCHAGNLQEGDCVIVRHFNKYLPHDKDMNVVLEADEVENPDYLKELKVGNMIDKPISQKKLEITARLIGASVSDGHISMKKSKNGSKIQYDAEFALGEVADMHEMIDDINDLGFGSCNVKRVTTKHVNKRSGRHTIYKTWRVNKGGAFAFYLQKMGAFVGAKVNQKKSVPEWIRNGNSRIKREFLSGFNGGDGARISMQKNQKYFTLHMGETSQTTHNDHLQSTIAYMTEIKDMYTEFAIEGKVGTRKLPDYPNKTKVYYSASDAYENIGKFADVIGYRYCNEKRRASAPVIEYVKYKNFLVDEKNVKYQKIAELEKAGYKPAQIVAETGIEYKFVKRILENIRNGKMPKPRQCDGINGDTLKYDKFAEDYNLDGLNLAIPIKTIKDIDPEPVYDFTTRLDSHSFIANGIVVSNCPVQTPEHAKVGLIKHISMIGSITIGDKDNTEVVREYVMSNPDVRKITDVKIHELKEMFKIFLNGEWIGMISNSYEVGDSFTDNPVLKLFASAKEKKIMGEFDPQMTSVVLDAENGELRFNTDSGRLYRPVLRVTGDNELILTKKMIDQISLKSENTDKITSWDDFYSMEDAPIEFLDSEEQPFYMVAPMIKDLNNEREKIIDSSGFKFSGREDKVLNRYSDKFYVRYDYCEIHPSVLLGEVATNIPFPNRNQGPRNIFQYAQGRQGMGIYNTVYRSRTDISYVMYHPETPIVNTRTSKYTYTDVLGPGANAIVAIATYGGYNQEDSLIFNLTSLQRALFRSMSLKKYVSQITKNQETSANDKFMKPTPDKTLSMKIGNYEKLNLEGYVPEETKLTNGDIIFGKVTPITDMPDSDKIFKDESEQFKSHSDGVVDRVYTGIHNQDGHEVRKALVRMERMPMIGDKFCSRHGQKGTMGIGLKASDMPYTKNGIRPDIIMNPNAIPSRMTIGQFWEQLMSKIGALLGINMDGTAFEDYDIEEVKELLRENGYDETGEEYLYNGMTGLKMKTSVFIAPCYYQRLKHMVFDKIHSRSRGSTTILVRQAAEGRSRDGGLRLGEMERDALIAHGMAKFLNEKMMYTSDVYSTYVCGICGLFAVREVTRNSERKPKTGDTYKCPMCKNYHDIHKIMIPYAFKLMIQELMAMNILARIRVKKTSRKIIRSSSSA
jgi:DNA-directed RNA polymerase beta subunit/intein/homing endonuclease